MIKNKTANLIIAYIFCWSIVMLFITGLITTVTFVCNGGNYNGAAFPVHGALSAVVSIMIVALADITVNDVETEDDEDELD